MLEDHYIEAYERAIELARDDNESASDDVLREVGRAAGFAAMVDGFRRGLVVEGTTGIPYSNTYGDYWDRMDAFLAAQASAA